MYRIVCTLALLLSWPSFVLAQQNRPNILLVLLDDVGFSDFGAYGSDTATPNIDRLAARGAKFSRYYTSPQCGPSRAMLMTGRDNHQVGMGTIVEALDPKLSDEPGYTMLWDDGTRTIASRLKEAGYQTFVTGKWGIGKIGRNLPHRFGFDRSYVLDATGASNYEERPYLALYDSVSWFEDGTPISIPPEFYSSRNLVDKMIEYVDAADPARPFFGFLSYQAVHIPVQVPREFVDRYDGVFDRGWDEMRKERLRKAIDLGLVPQGTTLGPSPAGDRRWADLSGEEKSYWARAMQVNAGMLEAADFHLGRLLKHLETRGQLENTIVIVTSDNGPEFNTIGHGTSLQATFERFWMSNAGWDVEFENLGGRGSLAAIGREWAQVSSAPLRLFKFNASEGGLRVPLVIAGPGIGQSGLLKGRAHVADLVPTLLEATGTSYEPEDLFGRSLMPMLTGRSDEVYGARDAYAIEVGGNAALYRDTWKIARVTPPFGDGNWHLYDLARDPGETIDLAAEEPVILQELLNDYLDYARTVGVVEGDPGISPNDLIVANAERKLLARHAPYLLVALFVLTLIIFVVRRALRRAVARRNT